MADRRFVSVRAVWIVADMRGCMCDRPLTGGRRWVQTDRSVAVDGASVDASPAIRRHAVKAAAHRPYLHAGNSMEADVAAWRQAARATLIATMKKSVGYAATWQVERLGNPLCGCCGCSLRHTASPARYALDRSSVS